jgi:hypothetical protein
MSRTIERLREFELPAQVQAIPMEHDGHQAATLERIADRLEGRRRYSKIFGRRYSLPPDTAIATLGSASLRKEHLQRTNYPLRIP